MAVSSFEFIHPNGTMVAFGGPPYVLREFGNIGSTMTTPQHLKSPFQLGESLLNVEVSSRTITLDIRIVVGNGDFNQLRRDLIKVFAFETAQHDEAFVPGTLRYLRDGKPTLQVAAVPRMSPDLGLIGQTSKAVDCDIEFVAHQPYWQDVADNIVIIDPIATKLQMPFEFPIEFDQPVASAVINVTGDISTPVFLEITGTLVQNPIIKNITTGEFISLTTTIDSTKRIEIDTAFGNKTVTEVIIATSARTNLMSALDFANSTFWRLKPGNNTVEFLTASEIGSQLKIKYRNLFSGL